VKIVPQGRQRSEGVGVLVVAADSGSRERIGAWLAEEGYEVLECPGPGRPDYTCLGGRGQPCPLARAADVVVLDLWLASDSIMEGTPSWRLLDYNLEHGHPVVAIADPEQPKRFYPDERVIPLDRPPDRKALLAAVDILAGRRVSVAEIGTLRLTPRRRRRPYWNEAIRTTLSMAKERKEVSHELHR